MSKRLSVIFFVAAVLIVLGFAWPAQADTPGPVRGLVGDGWADVVLGKSDFGQMGPNEVTAARVFNGGGVIVDRTVRPNRLYVYDGGNSRVLGLDHLGACASGPEDGAACTVDSDCPESACAIQDGRGADLVIGQPDFSHSGCNGDSNYQNYPNRAPASASSLCGLLETQLSPGEGGSAANMALDAEGNLYVPDWDNHRVLLYLSPFTTDTIADDVWGQADFTGNECNEGRGELHPDNKSLCLRSVYNEGFVGGVALDPENNLWITDNQNARVLRFPYDSETGHAAHQADLVLGQPDFTSHQHGASLAQLWAPAAVQVDASGSVYVADSLNNRILVFEPPLSTGMSATRQIGADLTLREPVSLEFDLDGNMWVTDRGNSQLIRFDPDGQVDRVLFKDVPNYDQGCGGSYTGDGPRFYFPGPDITMDSWNVCDSMGSLGIDSDGNIFSYNVGVWQDVWRFPAPFPAPTAGTAHSADHQIFKPYTIGEMNHVSENALNSVRGIIRESGQLIITDMGRILFWNRNTVDLKDGQPADGVVGPANFNDQAYPNYGKIDVDGQFHLYAIRGNSIEVYPLPLETGDLPAQTILNPLNALDGAITTFSLLAPENEEENPKNLEVPYNQSYRILGSQIILDEETQWGDDLYDGDIAASKDGKYLWISDSQNSRVLRVRDPLTNPIVDIVIGQADLVSNQCNRGLSHPTAQTLCYPGHISLDEAGNLFVSDHSLEARGNFRQLEYDASLFPDQPSATVYNIAANRVFGTGGSFTIQGTGAAAGPWEPAFDQDGRMYVGYNAYTGSRFPFIYESPLTNPLSTGTLNDYYSMAFSAFVDPYNTLYVGDLNRGRVLIYFLDPPPPGYTVSGKLVNQRGYGVPQGQVQVEHYIWGASGDDQGNFSVEDVTPGYYRFIPGQENCTFNPDGISLSVNGSLEDQIFQADCFYTISGTVMDGSNPLAGALVTAQAGLSTTTGPDGSFTFANLPPGLYNLAVSKTGYTFYPSSLAADLTNNDLHNLDMSGGVTQFHDIHGKITGQSGPIANVILRIENQGEAVSDANGDYVFHNLPEGEYTIQPQKTGFTFSPAAQSVTLYHNDLYAIDFSAELQRYELSGRVTVGTNSCRGVTLTIAPSNTATSAADGSYGFSGLLPGAYTITPSKSGYRFTPASRTVTISDHNIVSLDFSAELITYGISGRITEGDNPLENVSVSIQVEYGYGATSDADGYYHFTGLVPGPYSVSPYKSGYRFSATAIPVTITDHDVDNVNFSAELIRYNLSGIVTAGGEPLGDVLLTLNSGETVLSAADGSFQFVNLAPGQYTITPSLSGFQFSPASRAVALTYNNISHLDFSAELIRYNLSGRVTSGGEPVQGVLLTAGGGETATSAADGSYHFTGLLPGEYTLTPSKNGYRFTPEKQTILLTDQDLEAVNFSAELLRYAINGSVTSGGEALEGVYMNITPGDYTTSAADGAFHFTGLLPGEYILTPSKRGYRFTPASQTITIGDQDVGSIHFTAELIRYDISGEVMEGDKPVEGALITLASGAATATTTTTADGTYHFGELLPGEYTLTISKADFTFSPTEVTLILINGNLVDIDFSVVLHTRRVYLPVVTLLAP